MNDESLNERIIEIANATASERVSAVIPCQECPLRKLPMFHTNSPDEIAFIQSFKNRAVTMPAGGTLIAEGSNSEELYTLFSGWAFRYKTLSDGRRQILNFLLPGDFVGLQEKMADKSMHGVETITDVELCGFKRNGLWELYRAHPALGYDITWIAAQQEGVLDENLLSVGRRTGMERIAMLLIHLFKRVAKLGGVRDGAIDFPLTQQHIADALGLSLAYTNKTLKKLTRQGFHDIENGRLKMINMTALQKLAEYQAMELRSRPLI
jgi:CRP/FNR family transcriptional regulator, anaerobic regulatory protein